jgi:hypothetical protein
MADNDMFDSASRSAGDHAGVFEYDGETGYFYLYATNEKESKKVIGAIRVVCGDADFTEHDVGIRWDSTEQVVGLLIRDQLWAAFDLRTGAKYGGNYGSGSQSDVPQAIRTAFK